VVPILPYGTVTIFSLCYPVTDLEKGHVLSSVQCGSSPLGSLQLGAAHWVAGGPVHTTGVPMQFPRPSQASPVVQFLPSLHGVVGGSGKSLPQFPVAAEWIRA
jgi:hypothetical protein